jgi:beta-lactam-binding protein with PASTA domain
MPKVVGLSASEAIRELRERDLRAVVIRMHRSGQSGVVLSQAPIPGTAMIGGTWVRVDIASDSSAVPKAVPNVLGEPASWALVELRSLGLRVDLRVFHRQPCGTAIAETLSGIPVPRTGIYLAIAECDS